MGVAREREFFDIYAIATACLAILGHVFSLELLTMSVMLISLCAFHLIYESLRPTLAVLLMFLYQCSVENSPSYPSFSDYYLTQGRGVWLAILLVSALATGAYVAVRRGLFADFLRAPRSYVIPFALFALFLVTNGIFSGVWEVRDLIFGAVVAASLTLLPFIFIAAFREVDSYEFLEYFILLAECCALIFIVETVELYLFGSVITDGIADKGRILFGWGIWTTAGLDMAVLIPILFLGTLGERRPTVRFFLAHALYLCTLLTLSRNAIVFGTAAFAFSLVITLRRASRRARFLKIYGVIAAGVTFALPLLIEPLSGLFSDFIHRGFSDNGRYEMWRYGVHCFLESPLFGRGFFAIDTDAFAAENIFPKMLHNTIFQLLAACGITGLIGYLTWQISFLSVFFRKKSTECIMLSVSSVTFFMMSMLDSFLFHVQPAFVIMLGFAAAYKLSESHELVR